MWKCTNLLKVSRLTEEEQTARIDDITTRMDDKYGEGLALRFLAKEMLRDPFGFLTIWGTLATRRASCWSLWSLSSAEVGVKPSTSMPMISWRSSVRAKTQKWMAFAMCQATQTPT